jgi:hypothetical protein
MDIRHCIRVVVIAFAIGSGAYALTPEDFESLAAAPGECARSSTGIRDANPSASTSATPAVGVSNNTAAIPHVLSTTAPHPEQQPAT